MNVDSRPQSDRDLQLARDAALARRMRRGDPRAVDEFCRTYLPRLYRFARRRTSRVEDAEEVVQMVIMIAARRIETYRAEATLYSWLTSICRREWARHRAASARHEATVSIDASENGADDPSASMGGQLSAPQGCEPEVSAERRQLAAAVWECLDELPEPHALALELKYIEGFSSKQIASRLGLSDEAAQSLLARARRAFRLVCAGRLGDFGVIHDGI